MTHGGWGIYFWVWIAAFVVAAFFIFLGKLARRLSKEQAPEQTNKKTENKKINTTHFLSLNLTLLFFVLVLFLVPATTLFFPEGDRIPRSQVFRGIFAIGSIILVLALGVNYSSKKGDL